MWMFLLAASASKNIHIPLSLRRSGRRNVKPVSPTKILASVSRCVKRSPAKCERIDSIQKIGFRRRAREAPTVHDHRRRKREMNFRAVRNPRFDSWYVVRICRAPVDRQSVCDSDVSSVASPRLDPQRILLRIHRVDPLAELAIVASALGATSRAQREAVLRQWEVNEND